MREPLGTDGRLGGTSVDPVGVAGMDRPGAAPAHEAWMRVAIEEGEGARGTTGDNPWVGCVIVDDRGALIARGRTQGPGEDHAEIVAMAEARARGQLSGAVTLYSTIEPCSFHGRTPACSRAIVTAGVRRVVVGMRDPHPRVDGEGVRILRAAGVDVVEGICEDEVRRQLGVWVFAHHPHEPLRRAHALAQTHARDDLARLVAEVYGLDRARAEELVARLE
jgi:diaminohydroxyphosphoribosylaminopyrimidine deaminase / 5-amino-6-(5-phosphoribosylamino)uracil reductase